MSTLAYVDSETITQVDGAQSSRVPFPLPDDPYVAVRQAQLVDTDTESDLEEAPLEAEESHPLGSRVPRISEEFKASKSSGTRTVSSHSPVSLDSTAPLSPDHPLTHVLLTPTPTEFRSTRYKPSYETSSSSSPTLPMRKRYRGTSELILDTDNEGDELGEENTEEDQKDESSDAVDERERERVLDDEGHGLGDEDYGLDDESQGLKDEGLGLEEEEVVPKGQQQAVSVVETIASEPLGLGYKALRHRKLVVGEDQVPSTFEVGQSSRVYTDIPTYVPLAAPVQTLPSPEWSLCSLLVSPSSPIVPSPIASLVATSTATISVDEDHFIKVGAQLELYRSILYDYTHRLDALPPTLVVDIDKDVRELYTRSGAVKDEIFSQRYRFKSLEREQERATVTFRAL
ncbi:hypothetical protein Tco_1111295 [Tanacetum coccineum]|uniref:Uncharacterized protein n=1 Tax=Tanacetum coccineum TaxID=301880 RepID=A0ABQ5ILA2_9ASTR